jgi:hypothetical protein
MSTDSKSNGSKNGNSSNHGSRRASAAGTLRDFSAKALAHRRIGFGDLRRLQRDILPDGITSREEAEILIALDRAIAKVDKGWTEYLVGAVKEFVVWRLPPEGAIDPETSEWLVSHLSADRPTRTALAILRAVEAGARPAEEPAEDSLACENA